MVISYPRQYCNIYAYTVEHIQWSISTRDKLGTGPYTVKPLYKGQVGDGSFDPYSVEPLYKGQVGDGSFVPYTVEPLYKGQVGGCGPLSLIQWSLSTRDKLGTGPLSLIQWNLSTRDKLGMGPLSLIQWSLSTRDKLGMGPLSLIQWSLSSWRQVLYVPYTVEPLYKGQVVLFSEVTNTYLSFVQRFTIRGSTIRSMEEGCPQSCTSLKYTNTYADPPSQNPV